MAELTMHSRDYLFLRQYMPSLPRYIRHMVYNREMVTLEIADDTFQDFLLDYRSSYVRCGIDGQTVNDVGQRLNQIYAESIMPLLHE
jgi:hypothetical protein